MRRSVLAVSLLFVACEGAPSLSAEVVPEVPTATATPAPQTAPPESALAARVPRGEESGANDAPEASAPEAEAGGVEVRVGVSPAPNAAARVEIGGRTDHSGILRLTQALGLPRPLHIHGRPFSVPDSAQDLSLISFLDDGEVGAMHTELWLLERSDGELYRVAAAPVPHVPVPGYNDIAVGAEALSDVLRIKAQNIEDFDEDGRREYQVVIELTDEVVCGLGALTHRYAMIFNLPTLTTAFDVQTMESATATHYRSTILWSDANDDGHPDVDLRVRNCTRWSDESLECAQEQDAHVSFLWVEAEDRWVEAQELAGRVPCGEDG